MFVAAEARMGRYIYEKRFHNIPLNSFITVGAFITVGDVCKAS